VQFAEEVQEPAPLLDPEPLLLELPELLLPQRFGNVVQNEPPLDPEADPPLLELADPDDELPVPEQTPAWHAPPVVVQSEHRLPAVPHALSSCPDWQVPVLSQQPVAQFWAVHDAPAPLLLAAPLPLPPLLVEPVATGDPSSAVP
jgi:hypothetical protein